MNRRTFIGMLGLGAGAVASGVALSHNVLTIERHLDGHDWDDVFGVPPSKLPEYGDAFRSNAAQGEFTEADLMAARKKLCTFDRPGNMVLYMSMEEYERNWSKEFPLVGRE